MKTVSLFFVIAILTLSCTNNSDTGTPGTDTSNAIQLPEKRAADHPAMNDTAHSKTRDYSDSGSAANIDTLQKQ